MKSETFTIEAKAEGPQTIAMMRGPMLQALLEDRFKLKVRRDTEQVPIYALVVATGGPKLVPSRETRCTPLRDFTDDGPGAPRPNQPPLCGLFGPNSEGGTRTFGQTLAGLSEQFSALLDRDVVDRTGIQGTFDIDLDAPFDELFGRFNGPPAPGGVPPQIPLGAIRSAVQKLGLRLESTSAPETRIVIDSVERPSEN